LVYWYIVNKTNILRSQKTIKLLHIAPERNLQKILKSFSRIKYISGDLNPLVADRKIDITDINFENGYFDFIICNHVLEHIVDDQKAMRELFRVLKPEGFAILQVPTSPEEREKCFGQRNYVRIYGKDYKKRLESVGFKVDLYNMKEDLSVQDIKKYGLNEEEILYLGKK